MPRAPATLTEVGSSRDLEGHSVIECWLAYGYIRPHRRDGGSGTMTGVSRVDHLLGRDSPIAPVGCPQPCLYCAILVHEASTIILNHE